MPRFLSVILRSMAVVGAVAVLASCATQALPRDSEVTSSPVESAAGPSDPEMTSSPTVSPTVPDPMVEEAAPEVEIPDCAPPRGKKNTARARAIDMLRVERDEVMLDDLVLAQDEPPEQWTSQEAFHAVINAVETLDEDFDLAWIALNHEPRAVEALWKGEPPAKLAELAAVVPDWVSLVNRGGARFSLVDMHEAINRFEDAGYLQRFGVNMLGTRDDGMGVNISVGLDASDADIEAVHRAIDHCLDRAGRTNGDDELIEPVEPTMSLVTRRDPPGSMDYPGTSVPPATE